MITIILWYYTFARIQHKKLRFLCMNRIHLQLCRRCRNIQKFLSKQNPPPLGGEECAEELRNYVRFGERKIYFEKRKYILQLPPLTFFLLFFWSLSFLFVSFFSFLSLSLLSFNFSFLGIYMNLLDFFHFQVYGAAEEIGFKTLKHCIIYKM